MFFFFFKICTDIRLLANQKEIEEPFEKDQIGKSILTVFSFLLLEVTWPSGWGASGFPISSPSLPGYCLKGYSKIW